MKPALVPALPPKPKTIAIDPGHGGPDLGVVIPDGVLRWTEADLAFDLANRLEGRLAAAGMRVHLTRGPAPAAELGDRERTQLANDLNADLFISLHADSGGDPKVRGATVYTLSDHGVDRATRSVFNGGFINVQLPGRDLSVKQILLDLTQRHTLNRSGAFAEALLEKISTRTTLLRRSHRDAGYMVLLAPDVPAVLLEMGFITNPDDEKALTSDAQRRRMVDAVARSIESYFGRETRLASR